jgi:hypothetical protein
MFNALGTGVNKPWGGEFVKWEGGSSAPPGRGHWGRLSTGSRWSPVATGTCPFGAGEMFGSMYLVCTLRLGFLIALPYFVYAFVCSDLGICLQSGKCEGGNHPKGGPSTGAAGAQPHGDAGESGGQGIPTGTVAQHKETGEEQDQRDGQTDFRDVGFHVTWPTAVFQVTLD